MKPKETPVVEAANINNFGRNSLVTHTTGLIERVKRMNNEELLKVLDMSEDEQHKWVDNNCELEGYKSIGSGFVPTESLADLAFRLRDEACKEINGCEKYHNGLEAIYIHRCKKKQCQSFYAWLTYQLKPIDMIIATLTAKKSK